MSKTEETVTISKSQLKALIEQAMAEKASDRKADRRVAAREGQSERTIQNEIATVKAFKKAGFGDVTPKVDVLTYGKWVEKGYRVKKGESSVQVKNLRLFHKTQVEKISAEEVAAEQAKRQEAIARYEAKKAQPKEDIQAEIRRLKEEIAKAKALAAGTVNQDEHGNIVPFQPAS